MFEETASLTGTTSSTPPGRLDSSTSIPQDSSSETFRPYGYGQIFPSFSPRSSNAGDTDHDWTMAEEKILRDVAQWLSPADLRRARLVCKTWYGALATLTTKAATQAETLVPQWKMQLEAMLQAFPCLQELTISTKLSSVAAQQLGVLATAKQLHVLNLPYGQALQDRSLLALQPLASHLRELRINGASSLGRRSLLLLSVLANLEVLELKNCGKISWFELQQAWKAACTAYEVQATAEAASSVTTAAASSSGGGSGSSRFSSSGGGFGSKLGAWLPTGRLFRTSSPSSNSIQSAVAWQRAGTGGLIAKVQDFARGTSSAAAVAVAQLGIGAVGNGRSSCGGSIPESPARSLLHRKQKEDAAAASGSPLLPNVEEFSSTDTIRFASSGCFPVRTGLLRMMARSAAVAPPIEESPRSVSMLSRVGSLVWHNSSAASAGTGSSSLGGFSGSSGPSLAAQASCVQAALLAFIAQEEQAAAAAASQTGLLPLPGNTPVAQHADAAAQVRVEAASMASASSASSSATASGAGSKGSTAAGASSTSLGCSQSTSPAMEAAAASSQGRQPPTGPKDASATAPQPPTPYKPRRRTTGDKTLPAMPFTKLAALSFSCTEATLRSPGPELAAVAALTSLSSLEISKCKIPDAVFAHLQSLSRLNKLKLTGLWSMGDVGVQHIAQLTGLKSLALSEAMHVTASGVQVLSSLSQLTSLALGFTQDLGGGVLAQLVNNLPQLQCLEVAAPSWGDLDCELLAEAAARTAAPRCSNSGNPPAPGMLAAAVGSAGEAAAPAAAAASPQMLWDVARGSLSRGASRTSSSRQSVSPAARPGGLWSSSSNSHQRSHSFGSFSMPGAAQFSASAAMPACRLLVLRLRGCRALTSKGMAALRQLPELHTLVLEDTKEIPAAEVISQGLLPPKLTSLTMQALPFGNLFSGCISMPCCSLRLSKLELASLEGTHEGQLRRLLSFFPNVTELSLAGCSDLGDAALLHVATLPRLQLLNLGGCGIVGPGLEHLQLLPALRVLHLKACSQLSDAALPALEQLTALEGLDLSDCGGVSEEALLHIAHAVPRLVWLDVSGCKGATRALLSACPHYLSVRHSS